MKCQEFKLFSSILLDGELSDSDAGPYHAHLQECSACQGFLKSENLFRIQLRQKVTVYEKTPIELEKSLMSLYGPKQNFWSHYFNFSNFITASTAFLAIFLLFKVSPSLHHESYSKVMTMNGSFKNMRAPYSNYYLSLGSHSTSNQENGAFVSLHKVTNQYHHARTHYKLTPPQDNCPTNGPLPEHCIYRVRTPLEVNVFYKNSNEQFGFK